ncbi:MAG: ABC transporter permease [Chlamydiae bacterium]|nr:ABC transporter permease [Chlamydiota bacterium]
MEETVITSLPRRKRFSLGSLFTKKDIPFAIGCPALVWHSLFFYLPLLIMILSSVFDLSESGSFQGFTLKHFLAVQNVAHFRIIFKSIGIAFLTAILCFVIAFPCAYFLAFKGGRYKTLLLFFLIVPFWTNFLLHVCAWFFVLERNGFLNNLLLSLNLIGEPIHFLNSFFAIILMMVYHYLLFMILPIYSSLEKFNLFLFEASSDLGATKLQTFKRILLPLTLPAIRLGFLLVYIPAFGEFVIPELMGGDKAYYAGNVVSQYVLGNYTAPLGAAFTLMGACILMVSIGLLLWIFKRISKSLGGLSV